MRRLLLAPLLAALAACVETPSPQRSSAREEQLRQGFAARGTDPAAAASYLAAAGPGALLEQARVEVWVDCLERASPAPSAWREALAQPLPPELRLRVLEGLGRALLAAGEGAAGVAALEEAARGGRTSADERLLEVGEGAVRRRATDRMAVRAPHRLRQLDPTAERGSVAGLGPAQWLERTAAWRATGNPAAGAAELARRRWSGADERRRRVELARAELAAGAVGRALAALPPPAGSDSEELALRAQCLRRQAWGSSPAPAARGLFLRCLEVAERGAEGEGAGRRDALEAVLECGTEAGRLEVAAEAWWELHALGWRGERRDWLGRRLALRVLERPGRWQVAADIASSLPDQRRCLTYWLSRSAPPEWARRQLGTLAEAPFADLYGVWAREELGLLVPEPVHLEAGAPLEALPAGVQRLLEWGESEEAVREWRRVRSLRALSPAEAVAAAELELAQGRRRQTVAGLREALPELGRADMARAPAAAIRAYLPLEFEGDLVAAARRVGLDPWLLAAVARQESLFTPTAVSPRGARGLLQLLPGTARPHALALGLGPHPDLFDPAANLRLGARELAGLLRRFGAVEPALAAYNAGEGRAGGWWRRWPDRRRFTEEVPFPETYTYIRRVVFLAEAYRQVYGREWRGR